MEGQVQVVGCRMQGAKVPSALQRQRRTLGCLGCLEGALPFELFFLVPAIQAMIKQGTAYLQGESRRSGWAEARRHQVRETPPDRSAQHCTSEDPSEIQLI